jgi:hypothetical protein
MQGMTTSFDLMIYWKSHRVAAEGYEDYERTAEVIALPAGMSYSIRVETIIWDVLGD